jgi:hypothetical protein
MPKTNSRFMIWLASILGVCRPRLEVGPRDVSQPTAVPAFPTVLSNRSLESAMVVRHDSRRRQRSDDHARSDDRTTRRETAARRILPGPPGKARRNGRWAARNPRSGDHFPGPVILSKNSSTRSSLRSISSTRTSVTLVRESIIKKPSLTT